jgi:roadblock/LC7 domain-containing protein
VKKRDPKDGKRFFLNSAYTLKRKNWWIPQNNLKSTLGAYVVSGVKKRDPKRRKRFFFKINSGYTLKRKNWWIPQNNLKSTLGPCVVKVE